MSHECAGLRGVHYFNSVYFDLLGCLRRFAFVVASSHEQHEGCGNEESAVFPDRFGQHVLVVFLRGRIVTQEG